MHALLATRARAARAALTVAGALAGGLAACADQPVGPGAAPGAPSLGKTAGAGTAATVLFSGTQTGAPRIYAMGADGANVRRLTDGPGADESPTYAPGNKRFAFVRRTSGTEGGAIFTALANGSKPVQLTPASLLAANPEYSPDGTRIAFDAIAPSETRRSVFVMNADGTGVTRVTTSHEAFVHPSWSPDGTQLAVAVIDSGFATSMVATVAVATGVVTPRAGCQMPGCREPAWSPTGDRIVYGSPTDRLVLLDLSAQTAALLTAPMAGLRRPAWSTDGTRVLFDSEHAGTADIYTADVADTTGNAIPPRLTSLGGAERAPAPSR